MNRNLILLAIVAAAAIGLVIYALPGSEEPGSPAPPERGPGSESPDPPVLDEPDPAHSPPEGGVLVLDRHDRPVSGASVMSATAGDSPFEAWEKLGSTDNDGRLLEAKFRSVPGAVIFAGSRAGLGGPVAWKPAGVVVRLGDGCVVTGTVRDVEGNGVAGIAVGARREKSFTFSKTDGSYRLVGLVPGKDYALMAMADPRNPPEPVVVRFDRMGEEKQVDLVCPAPSGPGLLVDLRFSGTPTSETRLEFDSGAKEPAGMLIPPGPALVRYPFGPIAAGREVEVSATSLGFLTATERVKFPEAGQVTVVLTLEPGGTPAFGLVVDESGTPVADIDVKAHPSPVFADRSGWSPRTDGKGRFRLKPKGVGMHLVALDPGKRASRWFHLAENATEVRLVLEEACVVEGRVLDRETGAPVVEATVKLSFDLFRQGPWPWKTTTNEAGEYRFAGVPSGAFVWPWVERSPRAEPVEAGPQDHHEPLAQSRAEAVEKGLAHRFDRFGEQFRRDLTALAHRGGSCTFLLQFPEGEKVPEIVSIQHDTLTPWSQRCDTWEEKLTPDRPEVEIWLEEGTHQVLFRAGTHKGLVKDLEVRGDGDLSPRTVTLGGDTRIVAQLVDEDGHPLALRGIRFGVAHYIQTEKGRSGNGGSGPTSDASGRADLTQELPILEELGAENLGISINLSGEGVFEAGLFGPHVNLAMSGTELARRIRGAESGEVLLEIPVIRFLEVLVLVVDGGEDPMPGVRLRCTPEEHFAENEATTDQNGIARVKMRFDPEHWEDGAVIAAEPPFTGQIDGGNSRSSRAKGLGKKEAFGLVVSRSREVRVRIVDQEGQALANRLVAYGRRPAQRSLRTDTGGTVVLQLPRKTSEIVFNVRGHTTAPLEVPAGITEITYVATRNRELRIRVEAPPDLDPEPNLYVNVAGRRNEKVTLMADGTYEGGAEVPMGEPLELRIITPDRRWEASATVEPNQEIAILRLAGRTFRNVTFRLVDGKGEPLAAVTAKVDPDWASPDVVAFLKEEITTDAAGRVQVSLPIGEQAARLDVEGRGHSGRVKFNVPSGDGDIVFEFR